MKAPDLRGARVMVVGDVMLDRYWYGDATRISPEAPVPVVLFREELTRAGGAANVACNCAALGVRTHLLSVVGRQQQLLRIDFETLPSREVLASKLADFKTELPRCDVVILSDYGKGGLAHIQQMIKLGRAAGKRVLVDPKGDDYSRYKGAHVLTPNLVELREVIGTWKTEADLERRAQKLRRQLGAEALLLTRGAEGMTLYRDARTVHVKAEKREVYDVSGAGDTVIATLATMLAAGVALEPAVRIANRAGGIKVTKLGTAVVTKKELFG